MTAGLSFDFLNLIRVGVGLGPNLVNFQEMVILDDAGKRLNSQYFQELTTIKLTLISY